MTRRGRERFSRWRDILSLSVREIFSSQSRTEDCFSGIIDSTHTHNSFRPVVVSKSLRKSEMPSFFQKAQTHECVCASTPTYKFTERAVHQLPGTKQQQKQHWRVCTKHSRVRIVKNELREESKIRVPGKQWRPVVWILSFQNPRLFCFRWECDWLTNTDVHVHRVHHHHHREGNRSSLYSCSVMMEGEAGEWRRKEWRRGLKTWSCDVMWTTPGAKHDERRMTASFYQ